MEHSLHATASSPRKPLVAHLRSAAALAVALGTLSLSTANALADEQAPLSGQITPALSTIAAPGPIAGRYIVTFSSGTSATEQSAALANAGASDVSTIPALRMHVVDASDAAVTALHADPAIEAVEADQVRNVQAAPSDPGYSSQWSLSRIGWDQAFGSVNPAGTATVAILDTGIDASHPDLAGQVVPGTSILDPASDGTTDANGHGTWMAGIVAAATDNGTGIAGIGYAGVKVMPVTVLGAAGTGSDGDIINGVIYAADHGANVILMSFTNPAFSQSLQDAIDYAWSKGAVVVAAAGNDESATVNYPAGDRGVVGVANSDESDGLNPTSNYGQDVFMAAPGTNIYTTSAGGGYATISGTSAAAAEVAGAAALMKASSPDAGNGVIVGRLGADAEALSGGQQAGNGRLNLARAINDASTNAIEPAGAAPLGEGGPVVGPYVIAAKNIEITLAGNGGGSVAVTDKTDAKNNTTCEKSCGASVGNNDEGSLTATPAASSTFAGWSGQSEFVTGCTATAAGGKCNFAMENKAQKVTATFTKAAADGSGSTAVSPTTAVAGSGGNTLTFTYTAAAGGLNNGALQLSVPSGWSAPSTTAGTKGYTTSSAASVGLSGQNITLSGLTLASGASVTITYGDKTGGGAGADAPGAGSSGTSTFSTSEKSTSGGALTALVSPPSVTVTNAANGSGSIVVSPSAAVAASGGNTLTFTYTAVAGGLNGGALQVTVPSGWSAPSITSGTKGYTTSSAGTVSASGQTITVSGVTLSANATVTITYGDRTGGGAGADAPGVGTSTFNTSEKSTSTGTLSALTSPPSVHVTAPTVSTTFPANSAAYNAAGWAAGCATAGLCGTAGDSGSTISGVQVSIKRNSDNSYWSGTSFVAGSETYLAASGTTSWSFALAASALSDGVTYTVHSKSTDSVGNVSTVAAATFTYDTTSPSPTVSTPANNSSINKTTPAISGSAGTASGDSATVTVKIYNGAGTGGALAQTFNNVAVTSGSWSVSASALTQGVYTAQVTQGDSAGNSGSGTSTFTVDTTAPTTTDNVPAAYVNHDVTVTLTASDTDGSGVDKTYYTTDGSAPTTSSPVYNPASKPVLTSDGQVIRYFSTDKAGNEESARSATAHIDRAAPTTTDDVPSAYVNHDVTVTLTAGDTGGSGVDKTYYTTDGSEPTSASSVYNPASKPVLTADGQVIKYFSSDKAGNEETPPRAATAHIDRAAPTTTDDVPSAYVNHNVTVTLTAGDTGGSGLDKTYYTIDGSTPTTSSPVYNAASKPVLTSDGQSIKYFSSDHAGNSETPHSASAHIDTLAPTTTGAGENADASVYHSGDWTHQAVTVTLSASDPPQLGAETSSGVDKTFYKVDSATAYSTGNTVTIPAPGDHSNDGTHTITYYSTDKAGNTETTHTFTVKTDTTAPTSGATSGQFDNSGSIAVDPHATDASPSSGVASIDLYVKKPGDSTFTLAHSNTDGSSSFNYTVPQDESKQPINGSYSFYTIAHDNAGNNEAAKTSAESTTLEDTVAPTSGATSSPLDNSGSIAVDAHAADASPSSGVSSMELYVKKPGDSGFSLAHTNTDGSSSFNYTVPPDEGNKPVNGSYSFYTIAHDSAGNNEGSKTAAESTTLEDTVKPASQASAPATNKSASIDVSYAASDHSPSSGLASVELWVKAPNGSSYTKTATDSTPGASGSFTYTVPTSGEATVDGTYSFYTISTDNAGNRESVPGAPDASTTESNTIQDTQAPTTTAAGQNADASAYENGDWTHQAVTLTLTASDPPQTGADASSGVDKTFYKVDSAPGYSTGNTVTIPAPGDHSNDGTHTITYYSTDKAGNTETTHTFTVKTDTQAPTSAATRSQFDNTGTITIDAHATDASPSSGVASVDLYVKKPGDSTFTLAHTNTDGSSSFNYTVPQDESKQPTNGTYSFYTIAHDNAGNNETTKTTPDTTTLEDTVAPSSGATSSQFDNSGTIAVDAHAADASPSSGVASVDLYVKKPGDSTFALAHTNTDGSSSFNYHVPQDEGKQPVNGSYGFYTIAHDGAGNDEATKSSAESTTLEDTVAPSSGATSAQLDNTGTIAVDAHAADASPSSGVASVAFYVKKPGDSAFTLAHTNSDGSSSFNYQVPLDENSKPVNGDYSFYTIAHDSAGNVETAKTNAESTTLEDTVKPASQASAPATNKSASIDVAYAASDHSPSSGLASVELWVKVPNVSGYTKTATDSTPGASGSFTYTVPTSGEATVDGTYSFYTISTDNAGNRESVPGAPDATTTESNTIQDTLAPTTSAAGQNADASVYENGDWTHQAVTVTLSAADPPQLGADTSSGVDHTYYKVDSAATYSTGTTVTIPAPGDHSNDGTHTITYYSTDKAGNTETTHTFTVKTDTAAPSSAATSSQFHNTGTITIDAHATDASPSSGLSTVDLYVKKPGESTFSLAHTNTDGSSSFNYTVPLDENSKPVNGDYRFYTIAHDNAGNAEAAKTTAESTTLEDTVKPASQASAPATNKSASIDVAYAASDHSPSSGLASVELWVKVPNGTSYTKTATDATPGASGSFTYTVPTSGEATVDGTYSFYTISTDNAGNRESVPGAPDASTTESNTIQDTLAPTTSAAGQNADASVYTSGDWTHQAVTLTLTASDPPQTGADASSGVDKTFYKVDSAPGYSTGNTVTIPAPGDHTNDGTHTITYYSTDKAGNTEITHTFTVKTDTTAPTSGATSAQLDNTGTITVDAHATDATPSSGLSTVDLYVKKPGDSGFSLAHTNSDGSSSFNYTVPQDESKQAVNGSYSFYTIAHDTAGNTEATKTTAESTTLEDTVAPTTTDDVPSAYVNHDVTVTLSPSDTSGSGVDKTYYTTDGSEPSLLSSVYNPASKPVLTGDGQSIKYFSVDKAGNSESTHTATAHVDRSAPTTTDDVPSAYVNHDVTVTLTASDTGGSGLDKTYYTTDGSAPSSSSPVYNPASKPVLTSDGQVIKYFSTDKAGNEETTHSATAHIDRAAPTTTDNVPAAYVNGNVTVTLTASDTGGSGVDKTYYTTDGSEPTSASPVYNPASKPVLTSDGQTIKYFSSDKAGNTESAHSASAHIDRTAPTTTDDVPSAYVNHNVTVTLTAGDTGGSGLDKTYYTIDGSTPTTSSPVYNPASKPVLTSDGQSIKYFSSDHAGNSETPHSASAHIDTLAPTTTAAGENADASVYHSGDWTHQAVTVTLTASDAPQLGAEASSGVDHTYYKVDSATAYSTGTTVTIPAPGDHTNDGTHTITYYSTDKAGNTETTHTFTVKTDTQAPTSGATSGQFDNTGSIAVDAHAADASPSSGLTTVDLYVKKPGDSTFTLAHTNTDGSSSFNYTVPTSSGSPVNGSYSFYTIAHDNAGNNEAAKTSAESTTLEDTVKPATTDDVPGTYVNHDVTVTLTAGDTGGLGVDKTYYTTDGSGPSTSSPVYNPASKPVLTSDGQTIKYFSTDKAGNTESAHSATVHIDRSAPTTTDNVPSGYVNHDVTVTLTASDTGGSGLDKTYYTTDGSEPTSASPVYNPASKPVLTSDGQVIKYFSTDTAGNGETAHSATAHIDRSAPTTTDNVPSGQATSSITVTLTATDTGGSGVDKTYYTTDGSEPSTSSPVYNPASKPVLASDGQKITYFSTDKAGNAETPHSATAHIQTDTTAPTTTDNVDSNWHASPVSVTLTATDNAGGSGVKATSFKVYSGSTVPAKTDSGWQTYNPTAKPTLGNGQAIAYYSTDNAGNQESVRHSAAAKVNAVTGVASGATYTLGSVPAATCVDPSATVSYSGKVGQVTATCTDGGGAVSVTYTVAYCATSLTSPVSGSWVTSTGSCATPAPSTAVYNVAKGGSSVPLKFSLHGNQGLSIFAPGYPLSQQVLATGSFTDNTVTATAGESGLSYDPGSDQYTYVWKTSKEWSGQNRQLVIELNDGVTYIRANFLLK
jgi:Chitobiase/beta-hexosaminidase C-terminal domain/Bacterial Ig-like domain